MSTVNVCIVSVLNRCYRLTGTRLYNQAMRITAAALSCSQEISVWLGLYTLKNRAQS